MRVHAKLNPDGSVGKARSDTAAPTGPKVSNTVATLKQRRTRAMAATFGLLKNKNVFQKDGLVFERILREEW